MKEHVAEIVAAYARKNRIDLKELPTLIASVSQTLFSLGEEASTAPVAPAPAVPIRRGVTANSITCLDCGWSGKMLKRHLTTAHGMTPEQYRERWKLAPKYPMVSKDYAVWRSELAKATGLGKRTKS